MNVMMVTLRHRVARLEYVNTCLREIDMSDSYLAVGRVWELCGEDTVSDNDTSGMAARSEKMV